MVQLTVLLTMMALLFGYIGFTRGWNKEVIATSGIILGLFALFQFDDVLTNLLVSFPPEQAFAFRTVIFSTIVFFAYQTRALIGEDATRARSSGGDGRDNLQSSVLGGLVGTLNGYLIWGTLWYFQHVENYPLSPYITAPQPGSPSANFVESLPLYILAGGPGGAGNLLAAAVIVLFLIVLIVI
ncbi:MAG: CvpA family protein [Chitinophagaceae bacterium]|nr:CvpA family protein [Anaerolineae bacterium]